MKQYRLFKWKSAGARAAAGIVALCEIFVYILSPVSARDEGRAAWGIMGYI